MKKKGAITDVFIFMIITIVLVVFLGGLLYGANILKTTLEASDVPLSSELNLSTATEMGLSKVVDGMDAVKAGSFLLIFGMALTILLSSFFVKIHPVFFVIYVFVAILAVIVAVPISNFYETLLDDQTLGDTYKEFTASNFVILNLPLWVAILAIMGAVFLAININRLDEGFGGVV